MLSISPQCLHLIATARISAPQKAHRFDGSAAVGAAGTAEAEAPLEREGLCSAGGSGDMVATMIQAISGKRKPSLRVRLAAWRRSGMDGGSRGCGQSSSTTPSGSAAAASDRVALPPSRDCRLHRKRTGLKKISPARIASPLRVGRSNPMLTWFRSASSAAPLQPLSAIRVRRSLPSPTVARLELGSQRRVRISPTYQITHATSTTPLGSIHLVRSRARDSVEARGEY